MPTFELDRSIRLVDGQSPAEFFDMPGDRRQAPCKRLLAGRERPLVFHRDPQIHGEWLRCQRADLRDDVVDGAGRQAMRPEGPQPPKFETAAVSFCEESPPKGPCTIGYSTPTRFEKRV